MAKVSTEGDFARQQAGPEFRARYRSQTNGGDFEDHRESARQDAKDGIYRDDDLTSAGFKLVKVYSYTDPDGRELYQSLRYEHTTVRGAKTFRQRHMGATNWLANAGLVKVPYRWSELVSRPNETIFYCEGEKDADRLASQGLLATTLAGQQWSPEAAKALAERDVVVLPDNDPAGRKHAGNAANRLRGFAKSIRVIELPELGFTQDVSDWLNAGHTVDDLRGLVESARPIGIGAIAAGWIDPERIPLRTWLYEPHYIRQFASLIISTGGVGKSSLAIVEALAMVSTKPLLGVKPQGRLRVWYWNGEDPLDELKRRFAGAAKHYQLSPDDVGDRLFVNSGRDMPIVIAQEVRRAVQVNEAIVHELISTVRENKIDVVIVDPFVSCHRVSENDNTAIERVAKTWGHIAETTNSAVMLVHHSRKPNGNDLTVDDGRGASALLAAARSARALNTMSNREAAIAEIPEHQRRSYFRADIGKANLTRPPEATDWFRLVPIDLGNGGPLFGDEVGVVTRWSYPNVEQPRATVSDIRRCQDAIASDGPWRTDQRSKNWAGTPIAQIMGLDPTRPRDRKAVAKLMKDWQQAGWLREVEERDKTSRKLRRFIVIGKSAPVEASGAPAGDRNGC